MQTLTFFLENPNDCIPTRQEIIINAEIYGGPLEVCHSAFSPIEKNGVDDAPPCISTHHLKRKLWLPICIY